MNNLYSLGSVVSLLEKEHGVTLHSATPNKGSGVNYLLVSDYYRENLVQVTAYIGKPYEVMCINNSMKFGELVLQDSTEDYSELYAIITGYFKYKRKSDTSKVKEFLEDKELTLIYTSDNRWAISPIDKLYVIHKTLEKKYLVNKFDMVGLVTDFVGGYETLEEALEVIA